MKIEGDDTNTGFPPPRAILHYHGDATRGIFVAAAVILIIAKSTGADVPLSTMATVAAAILVVAAGVTNPAQTGIHWLNAVLAAGGALLFGVKAVEHYQTGAGIFDGSFVYIELLALLSLLALYNTTRTIRGILLRPKY